MFPIYLFTTETYNMHIRKWKIVPLIINLYCLNINCTVIYLYYDSNDNHELI